MSSQAHIIDMKRVSSKSYKYTRNGVYISEQQRDFYEENGFVVFRNLVDHGLLDECKQRFLDICHGKVDRGKVIIMKDVSLKDKNVKGEFLINKIHDFTWDDILFKYVAYPKIVDIVESIIGPNITACHTMLINKPPDSHQDASRHPLHQDLNYFPFRPADSVVACWAAMELVDERNGCLFVIPGSHKRELYKHDYPPDVLNKTYHGVLGFENIPKTNLVMEKGDAVFFHPLLLHGSGPNLTKGFRKAISSHYADSNCYFIDVRGTVQDNIRKDVEELAVKWKYPIVEFNDMWKYRSRLIKGIPGNFQRFDSAL